MSALKRGLTVAAAILAAVTALPAAASAAITPDPYATTVAAGRATLVAALGTSGCTISNATVNATGTATGATISVPAYLAAPCYGMTLSWVYSSPLSFTVDGGNVTLRFIWLKVNVLGGHCQYWGTLTGTMTNGSDTLTVSGTETLARTLRGICPASMSTTFTLTLPGAAITW